MFKTKSGFNKVQNGAYDSYDRIGPFDNHEFLKTGESNQSPLKPISIKQEHDLLKVAISNGQNNNHLQ